MATPLALCGKQRSFSVRNGTPIWHSSSGVDRMRAYYERLGWKKLTCEVLIDQPAGKVPSPFHVMTIPFDSRFEVIDSIDLDSASW